MTNLKNPTLLQTRGKLRPPQAIRLASSTNNPGEGVQKEFKGDVSSLFGNVRIPAALFAGASAGAAFAMPLVHGEGLKVGLVKRVYSLLMMFSLSSEILAVIIATLAMSTLATHPCPKTSSVAELIEQSYAFEWVAARWHFLSGLVTFILGIGLRAWISISCPLIAKSALSIILSSAFMCLAFIQETQDRVKADDGQGTEARLLDGVVGLPLQYLKLLGKKSLKSPLFALAFAGFITTTGYTLMITPHLVRWLSN